MCTHSKGSEESFVETEETRSSYFKPRSEHFGLKRVGQGL